MKKTLSPTRNRSRLSRECAKLDPKEERKFADLGFKADIVEWPEYQVSQSRRHLTNRDR